MSAAASDLPLVVELQPPPDVESALLRLASQPYSLLLDSALRDPRLGRYSFLSADPFELLTVPADGADGLAQLAERLKTWPAGSRPDLPPFQGGAAGLFSYDLSRSLERIASPRHDEFGVPAMAIGFYDVVLAFDHAQHRAWLISQGLPEREPSRRLQRAAARIDQFQTWLAGAATDRPNVVVRSANDRPFAERTATNLAPSFPVPGPAGLLSNFTADAYRAAVQRAIDYIYAGDIFQVNLSQRLLCPAAGDALSLYLRLRQCNPAPFAGWFDLGEFQIASASPERFLSVRDRQVEARPIKGTRRRTTWAEADLFAGDDLLQSEKDRAENVMIVDLLRNDLSRVCTPGSVHVSQLCGLEIYQFVQHLVSVVRGELAPGRSPVDLIRAAFPGGSITGAPKVRAMEIIAELEPTARGPYCGALGYIGFDGAMDLNILIRTITAGRGWWQFPVGGGIVAQSSPQREYEETWHKAEGLLRALVPMKLGPLA
ncbi:MAG TPA: anthranilate synthase component I family protein [Pirellulaceae bacterium]|nr:anthranilate synthase component I family protein [Pirellulaceae bacterium]